MTLFGDLEILRATAAFGPEQRNDWASLGLQHAQSIGRHLFKLPSFLALTQCQRLRLFTRQIHRYQFAELNVGFRLRGVDDAFKTHYWRVILTDRRETGLIYRRFPFVGPPLGTVNGDRAWACATLPAVPKQKPPVKLRKGRVLRSDLWKKGR